MIEPLLKQRLIGGIVILALAVIFVPMILDGSGSRLMSHTEIKIPPKPHLKPYLDIRNAPPITLKRSPDTPDADFKVVDEKNIKVVEVENVTQTPVVTQPFKQHRKTSRPKEKSISSPTWVVQVGSFNEWGKAVAERDRLRKEKIAAVFVEKHRENGKRFYRVRLGPMLKQSDAVSIQEKLKKRLNLAATVMRYRG